MSSPSTTPSTTPSAPSTTVEEGTKRGTVTTVEPTRAQTGIARRMAEVRATAPQWTASVDVDVEELVTALGSDADAPEPIDAIARAVGVALVAHPRVNGAWRDGKLESWSRATIALAVDVDGGSIALPTLPDVDHAPLADIAARRRHVVGLVRDGALRAPDSAGPTFALIDGGPDGPDRFDAITPPGLGASLAVGRIARRPVVVGDAILPRHTVTLTLTADHRAIYPSHAAAFLRRVADLLGDPGQGLLAD
ncbi:MAG: 2-oxo acid dehydrogenase subunit E2 [Solirubrobacteraceae bacterium]|nr:2-oxo acid dehydrogenase subunit E2 [Solirubrobacteraceae bacterium]